MIITVRDNRKLIAVTGAQATKYPLYQTTAAAYESLTGNLQKNRIVHLQYVAVDQGSVTSELFWGTEPLQSKDVDDTFTSITANVSNPLAVDRWSYDTSMYLSLEQTNTQNYYFQIYEYEVVAYTGEPPRPYWQLMANGQSILVETDAQAAAAATVKLGAPKRR